MTLAISEIEGETETEPRIEHSQNYDTGAPDRDLIFQNICPRKHKSQNTDQLSPDSNNSTAVCQRPSHFEEVFKVLEM